MQKIPLTDGSGKWFDIDAAKCFPGDSIMTSSGEEICRATGISEVWESLYLTANGSFVLVRSCTKGYHPEHEGAKGIGDESGIKWLIANGYQEAAENMHRGEAARLEI